MTMLFNRQIVRYLGTDALSVYGLIVNISMFVQCYVIHAPAAVARPAPKIPMSIAKTKK